MKLFYEDILRVGGNVLEDDDYEAEIIVIPCQLQRSTSIKM